MRTFLEHVFFFLEVLADIQTTTAWLQVISTIITVVEKLTEVEKLTHHFGEQFCILHIQFWHCKLNVRSADFLFLSIWMCVYWWGKIVYVCRSKKKTEEVSGMTRTGCSNLGSQWPKDSLYSSTHLNPLPLSIPRVQVLGLSIYWSKWFPLNTRDHPSRD